MCNICKDEKVTTPDEGSEDEHDSDVSTSHKNASSTSMQFRAINEKLDALLSSQVEITMIKKEMTELIETVKKLTHEVVEVRSENEMLKAKISTLERQGHERCSENDQQAINNNILIYGIQSDEKENHTEILKKIATSIGTEIREDEIEITFRGKHSSIASGSTKAIHVNFKTNESKMKIMSAMKGKKLNTELLGCPMKRPIYINEQLTSKNQKLYKEARELRRQKIVKFAWVKNGVVYVRQTETSQIIKFDNQNINEL